MARIVKLNAVMRETLREFGLDKKAKTYAVITDWKQIVGDSVAAVTTPEKLTNGVLQVKVANPVWKYELTMRKAEILSKIAKAHPYEVKDIVWK
jgi:predicted nucleic acid-binding Zn ribbon protein